MEALNLIKRAHSGGIAMGGNLTAESHKRSQFLVWAVCEPTGGWLQRAQIFTSWVDNEKSRKRVSDVACAEGLVP